MYDQREIIPCESNKNEMKDFTHQGFFPKIFRQLQERKRKNCQDKGKL